MNDTKVLDHGHIKLIETWGTDERVIESARMSTGKGFNGWGGCGQGGDTQYPACNACGDWHRPEGQGDEKLLRFLYEHGHMTPFEMAGATIEVQAPIFVFREWHRHRTQSYNEMSARYMPLPDVNYIPSVERLMLGSDGKNKQAGTVGGAGALSIEEAASFRGKLACVYDGAEQLYQWALLSGVPKELARVHLPVGRYSRMRASANLRNWLGFLALRSSVKNKDAQWEIRQYADAAHHLFSEAFPRTLALFEGSAK